MLSKEEIAAALEEIATLLELQGENIFKVRAHENAARLLVEYGGDLKAFIEEAKVGKIKGIGEHLCQKIETLFLNGKLPELANLRALFPEGIFDLLKVPGLGTKKVKILYDELKIKDLPNLKKACEKGEVATLKGFGEKTQEKILKGLKHLESYATLFLYADAIPQASDIVHALKTQAKCTHIEIAGSLRRKKELVKDIDIVATSDSSQNLMQVFVNLPQVQSITSQGETRASVLLKTGLAVDLRVVKEEEFYSALLHFTGSKAHNTKLRSIAQEKNLKLNEYGLFGGTTRVSTKSEKEIYKELGLSWMPPEVREDLGEIEIAGGTLVAKKDFPKLVELGDLRGVFHVHTTYSDGKNSLREMVLAAKAKNYEYIGISDHSQNARYAGGLSLEDIQRQHKEIDILNKELSPFRIFRGIESDILADGSLDYTPAVLKSFDFVVVSIHTRFQMSEAEMTARVIKALKNPATTILGHITGRLLLEREPYPINIQEVLKVAALEGVAVELNSSPQRLELDWRYLRQARELGIKIPINPDAHSVDGLSHVEYGVGIARKGYLSKEDVPNCWELNKVEKFLLGS